MYILNAMVLDLTEDFTKGGIDDDIVKHEKHNVCKSTQKSVVYSIHW